MTTWRNSEQIFLIPWFMASDLAVAGEPLSAIGAALIWIIGIAGLGIAALMSALALTRLFAGTSGVFDAGFYARGIFGAPVAAIGLITLVASIELHGLGPWPWQLLGLVAILPAALLASLAGTLVLARIEFRRRMRLGSAAVHHPAVPAAPQASAAFPVPKAVQADPDADPMAELNALIGLAAVKTQVGRIVARVKTDAQRRAHDLPVASSSSHLVFTGNPGTGKTTVARLMAGIYRQLGIIEKGHLVEATRADLVGRYIGETALKTEAVVKSAVGGVLFIDEAYTLAPTSRKDFGGEALATLLALMENYRDRLVVIVAGYPNEMKRFISANPGLASRFKSTLRFEDYNAAEMLAIFERLAGERAYRLTEAARGKLKAHLSAIYESRDANFGNGREVRNVFETVIANQAGRLSELDRKASREELIAIEAQDVPGPAPSAPKPRRTGHELADLLPGKPDPLEAIAQMGRRRFQPPLPFKSK